MADAKKASASLDRILQKLETKSEDGYGVISFQAKALGKSKDSVHLAVENGIIAVPLSEIQSIRPIPGRSELEIAVEVGNGAVIRHLRRVPDGIRYPYQDPGGGPIVNPPGGFNPHGPGGDPAQDGAASTSSGECTGIDTTTSSAGEADQTDDYRQSCWHDPD